MSKQTTNSNISRYYVRFYGPGRHGKVNITDMEVSIDTEAQPKTEQFENEVRKGLAALCPNIEPDSWIMHGRIKGPYQCTGKKL